jgi:MFS family permease
MWTAVLLIGIAMAAHQGFSANLFTLVSDTLPRGAVASAVGLAGGISSVAGAFSAAVIGRVLDATGGNYTVVFFVCACVYVIAVAMIHWILPRTRGFDRRDPRQGSFHLEWLGIDDMLDEAQVPPKRVKAKIDTCPPRGRARPSTGRWTGMAVIRYH